MVGQTGRSPVDKLLSKMYTFEPQSRTRRKLKCCCSSVVEVCNAKWDTWSVWASEWLWLCSGWCSFYLFQAFAGLCSQDCYSTICRLAEVVPPHWLSPTCVTDDMSTSGASGFCMLLLMLSDVLNEQLWVANCTGSIGSTCWDWVQLLMGWRLKWEIHCLLSLLVFYFYYYCIYD